MRTLAILLLALAAAATSARSQDLPARAGRIAHIEGRASLYQDPDTGWEKAYVNSPITSENSVWIDADSRAEVRVSSMALRLDQLTQLDFARLEETEVDAFVARGSVSVNLRHKEPDERLVFSTPNTRVRLRLNGRYRIDVDPDRNESRITVFEGEARIGGDDAKMRVGVGRSVLVFGAEPAQFVEERAVADAFDRWAATRDERWSERDSATYVSPFMTGYEDLNANGEWVQEPDYGALWYPSHVAAGWAPYRYGHWDNVRPWGWTWIDDAPWGYAPFHYGRWVYVRNRWAWVPGERIARPVWAPALVAWVGGSSYGVTVAGGPAVGWYPLSPWDRYDPWFRASPAYVTRVNVVVRTSPPRDDRRQWHESTHEHGTTVVDRRALYDRQPIARVTLPVTAEAIRRAPRAQQPNAVLPTREDFVAHRRDQPQATAPAPVLKPQAVARPAPQSPPSEGQPQRNTVAHPNFAPRPVPTQPQQAASAPPAEKPASAPAASPPSRAPRDAQRQQQQQQQQQQQRQQQQQQHQPQQQPQHPQQENAQREAQQQQERAAREAQQRQQREKEKEKEKEKNPKGDKP